MPSRPQPRRRLAALLSTRNGSSAGTAVAALALALSAALGLVPPAGAQEGAFLHIAEETGVGTYIDDPLLNGRPEAIFFVQQIWNPPGGFSVYNDHPIEVYYYVAAQRWAIENADLADMPLHSAFNVWVPPADSTRVFLHTATAANSLNNWTVLDHPLLNGSPSQALQVTVRPSGPLYPHHVALWYNTATSRWAIYNEDEATMPAGARFAVCIQDCDLFKFSGSTGYGYHTTFASNTEFNRTYLPNPNRSRWNFLASHSYVTTRIDSSLGVYWEGAEPAQAIFREDEEDLPLGENFRIAVTTGIFWSGFEHGGLLGWTVTP